MAEKMIKWGQLYFLETKKPTTGSFIEIVSSGVG